MDRSRQSIACAYCDSMRLRALGNARHFFTAMEQPKTIHDFGGFPRALYEYQYPAPGSSTLAHLTQETTTKVKIGLDQTWGLDHGTWSVLCRMFPRAEIPVVQLSLDHFQSPEFHYALGKELNRNASH